MTKNNIFKKFILFFMAFLIVITLVACGNNNKTPLGSIGDDVYVEIGGQTVTEKQLYEALRFNANDYLAKLLDEALFAEYVAKVDFTSPAHQEPTSKVITQLIFNTTSIESISEMTDSQKAKAILAYADTIYMLDPTINTTTLATNVSNAVEAAIVAWDSAATQDDKDDVFVVYEVSLFDRYKLGQAQRLFAAEKLQEVQDENRESSEHFITEKNLVSLWNNTRKGRYQTTTYIVDFKNMREANLALYRNSIKPSANNSWYNIYDITVPANLQRLRDNVSTPELLNSFERAALEAVKNHPNFNTASPIDWFDPQYNLYYDNFRINSTDNVFTDQMLTDAEVFGVFVKIKNELTSGGDDTDIANWNNTNWDSITFEWNDPIFRSNSALKSHVYGLNFFGNTDTEDTGKPYSGGVQTLGSTNFLVFVLNDERQNDKDIITKNDDKEDVFVSSDVNPAIDVLKDELRKELFDSKLTESFITEQISKKYEDTDIKIFDEVIKLKYNHGFTSEAKGGFINNNVLAKIGDTEIKVDELWAAMEPAFGASTAIDIITERVINESYDLDDTLIKEKQDTFKSVLDTFKSGGYEASGFPKSIGLNAFLILNFNSLTNQDAFERTYLFPERQTKFYKDYQKHFGDTEIFEAFADLSSISFENSAVVTLNHLLVYIDLDNDGNPDNPNDLTAAQLPSATSRAELFAAIYHEASKYITLEAGLKAVVAEYQQATRHSGLPTPDFDRENMWTTYKQQGFFVKYETIGSFSNQTNFPTSSSQLDKAFFDKALEVANLFFDVNGVAASEGKDTLPLYDDSANAGVQSSFGWHAMLVTGMTERDSAKFEVDGNKDDKHISEIDSPWNSGTKLDAYNDNDVISKEQIAIYILEGAKSTGVESLPDDVTKAISTYFEPVLTRYNSAEMRLFLSLRLISKGGSTWFTGNATVVSRIDGLITTYTNKLNNYSIYEGSTNSLEQAAHNVEYAALYSTWFDQGVFKIK